MPLTAGTRTDRALAPPDMATLAPFIRPFPAGASEGLLLRGGPGLDSPRSHRDRPN